MEIVQIRNKFSITILGKNDLEQTLIFCILVPNVKKKKNSSNNQEKKNKVFMSRAYSWGTLSSTICPALCKKRSAVTEAQWIRMHGRASLEPQSAGRQQSSMCTVAFQKEQHKEILEVFYYVSTSDIAQWLESLSSMHEVLGSSLSGTKKGKKKRRGKRKRMGSYGTLHQMEKYLHIDV